jgi:hypothetical protein
VHLLKDDDRDTLLQTIVAVRMLASTPKCSFQFMDELKGLTPLLALSEENHPMADVLEVTKKTERGVVVFVLVSWLVDVFFFFHVSPPSFHLKQHINNKPFIVPVLIKKRLTATVPSAHAHTNFFSSCFPGILEAAFQPLLPHSHFCHSPCFFSSFSLIHPVKKIDPARCCRHFVQPFSRLGLQQQRDCEGRSGAGVAGVRGEFYCR